MIGLIFPGISLFTACSKLKPEPIRETSLDSVLFTPVSTLVIPIRYEVKELENLINSKIKGRFINQGIKLNEKGDSLYLEVTRIKPISLQWRTPVLKIELPVDISGKFSVKVAGVQVRNSQPIRAQVIMRLASEIHLNQNWQLNATSTIDHIEWLEEPTLNVAFVQLNLRKPIEKFLGENQARLTHKLDSGIREGINTRALVEKLWMDLQKPIRVNKKKSQVWLKGYGENITARLMDTGPDFISLEAKLLTYIHTILEDDSIPPSNKILPPFKPKEDENDSINAFVLMQLPFNKLNQILQDEIGNKKIEASGFAATIKSIKVYGSNTGLAVQVKLGGDVDGDVFFHGDPYLSADSSVLRVKNFAFDINSENALARSAGWLLDSHFTNWIASRLQWQYDDHVNLLPSLIEQGLEKGKLGEKIKLSIDQFHVRPQAMLVTKKDIQLLMQVTGKAAIGLEKAIFTRSQLKN